MALARLFNKVREHVKYFELSSTLKTCRNRTGVGNLWHRARVGQLAVVLIDALRADFVLDRDALRDAGVDYGPGSAERPKIAFLEAAIAERWAEARAVVAKATPPTVTLPRLKVHSDKVVN